MPSEVQYAASVTAYVRDGEGGSTAIYSPTFFLHPDVQGITSEAHAKSILTDWLQRISERSDDVSFDVAVAATTVDTPDYQANALLRMVKRANIGTFHVSPFDLPADYVLVTANDGFACGIAPDGAVSS